MKTNLTVGILACLMAVMTLAMIPAASMADPLEGYRPAGPHHDFQRPAFFIPDNGNKDGHRPPSPLQILGRLPEGPSGYVALGSDDLLYVNNGSRLDIYDISTPGTLVPVGNLSLPSVPNCLAADGRTIFLGTYNQIMIVSATDETAPVLVGSEPIDGTVSCLLVEETEVFAGSYNTSVTCFTRNGTALTENDVWDQMFTVNSLLRLDGDILIGGASAGSVLVDGVTGSTVHEYDELVGAMSVIHDSGVLYASTNSGDGFRCVDVSDPLDPILLDICPSYGSNSAVLNGTLAYNLNYSGVQVVDITNPAVLGCGTNIEIGGFPSRGVMADGYLYVSLFEGGIEVWDVASNPSLPAFVSAREVHGASQQLEKMGDHLLVTQGQAGIKTMDISDPSSPVQVGSFSALGNVYGIARNGDTVFATNGTNPGLLSLDASDPENLSLLDEFTIGQTTNVLVHGDVAYVGTMSDLITVDVSDPANMTELGQLAGVMMWDGLFIGNYLYATCGEQGLKVVDISDPADPTLVSTVTGDLVFPWSIAAFSSYLLVGDLGSGGFILDVGTDPTTPALVSTLTTSPVGFVAASGDYFCMHIDGGDYELYDASTPLTPVLLGTASSTSLFIYDLLMDSNKIYAAELGAGITVLENQHMVPVYMARAEASWQAGRAVLSWTLSEADLGTDFRVWRQIADGNTQVISEDMAADRVHFTFTDEGLGQVSEDVRYWLQARTRGVDLGEMDGTWFGPYQLMGSSSVPMANAPLSVAPNPFNPMTRIQYRVDHDGPVNLRVFDLSGRLVETLYAGQQTAGVHEAFWNGMGRGVAASSGLYMVSLETESGIRTQKIMLTR